MNPEAPLLSFSVIALELFLYFMTLLSIYCFWNRIVRTSTPLNQLKGVLPESNWPTVDVFIPCVNEPLEVVETTLRAARALEYPADRIKLYILDDGGSAKTQSMVESVSSESGPECFYIAREKKPGVPHFAKAGNLNHAFFSGKTHGEFLLLLDCDQVCRPEFLQKTLPYFFDLDTDQGKLTANRVGFVQTPDSPWNVPKGDPLGNDGRFFYVAFQQGHDGMDSLNLIGSNVVVRREALDEVGGFFQLSVTEDIQTGFFLHAHGWKGRFHSEILAKGMAPEDLPSMLRQRLKWAEGMFQLLLKIDLKLLRALSDHQLVSYFRILFYNQMVGPVVVVLVSLIFFSSFVLGKSFMVADPVAYVAFFLPYFVMNRVLFLVSCSGVPAKSVLRSEQHTFYLAPIALVALFRAFFLPKKIFFWVTPKGKKQGTHFSWLALPSLILWGAFVAGLGWLGYLVSIYSFNSLPLFALPAIWVGHFLLCLWPGVRYSFWPDRTAKSFTFDDKLIYSTRLIDYIFLPTNFSMIGVLVAAGIAWSKQENYHPFTAGGVRAPASQTVQIGQTFAAPLNPAVFDQMKFLGFEGNESCFSPRNVSTADGALRLSVMRKRMYCDGKFHGFSSGGVSVLRPVPVPFQVDCRLKLSSAPGVITQCSTYGTSAHQNFGVWSALVGGQNRSLNLNYFISGEQHREVFDLDFDASEAFHDYRIRVTADRIEWSVDGRVVRHAALSARPPQQWISVSAWPSSEFLDFSENWNESESQVASFFITALPDPELSD